MGDEDSTSLLYDFEHARHKRDTEAHPVAQEAWMLICGDLERAIAVRNARAVEPRDREITASNLTADQILEARAMAFAAVKAGNVTEMDLLAAFDVATDSFSFDRRHDARIKIAAWCNARRNHTCCTHPVERHAYNGCADCKCGLRWVEHPGRMFDMSHDQHTRDAISKQRIGSAAERLTTEQIIELKAQLPKYTVAVSKKLSAACEKAVEFFDSDERTAARTLIAAWIAATEAINRSRDAINEAYNVRMALINGAP